VTQQIFEERKRAITGALQKTQTMQMQQIAAMQTMKSPVRKMITTARQKNRTPIGREQNEALTGSEDFDANTGAQYLNSNYISG
jgi:hypothetical protein